MREAQKMFFTLPSYDEKRTHWKQTAMKYEKEFDKLLIEVEKVLKIK